MIARADIGQYQNGACWPNSDGAADVTQAFEITVANTNLAPKILPLQLVSKGDTLGFTLVAADADGGKIA